VPGIALQPDLSGFGSSFGQRRDRHSVQSLKTVSRAHTAHQDSANLGFAWKATNIASLQLKEHICAPHNDAFRTVTGWMNFMSSSKGSDSSFGMWASKIVLVTGEI